MAAEPKLPSSAPATTGPYDRPAAARRALRRLAQTPLTHGALLADAPQTASALDIYHCFRLILGRAPSPPEWPGHSAQAGKPLADVVDSFIGSREFAARGLGGRVPADWQSAEVNGARIHASPHDQAVGAHVLQGHYEPHITRLFHRHLRPGMHVVDVGANIGYFALLAASLVGERGRVHALEPNAHNARLLHASRQANGFEHLTIHQLAAGSVAGLRVLHTAYSNGTTSAPADALTELMQATTVACLDLDTLLGAMPRLDLLKIDVEGAEHDALLGARQLLARHRPIILSEFSPPMLAGISGATGQAYLQLLLDLDYTLAVVGHAGEPTDCGRDADRVMAAFAASGVDHIDILATPAG